jgi:hypothetical protein
MAGKAWAQSVSTLMAARRWRPPLRRGRLAQDALPAMRHLHGHRKVFALPDHDFIVALGFLGLTNNQQDCNEGQKA